MKFKTTYDGIDFAHFDVSIDDYLHGDRFFRELNPILYTIGHPIVITTNGRINKLMNRPIGDEVLIVSHSDSGIASILWHYAADKQSKVQEFKERIESYREYEITCQDAGRLAADLFDNHRQLTRSVHDLFHKEEEAKDAKNALQDSFTT